MQGSEGNLDTMHIALMQQEGSLRRIKRNKRPPWVVYVGGMRGTRMIKRGLRLEPRLVGNGTLYAVSLNAEANRGTDSVIHTRVGV
jgi:hypothetical protein